MGCGVVVGGWVRVRACLGGSFLVAFAAHEQAVVRNPCGGKNLVHRAVEGQGVLGQSGLKCSVLQQSRAYIGARA